MGVKQKHKLDYQRPIHKEPAQSWCRTDLSTGAGAIVIVFAANAWLVWSADKSWGSWLWVFVFIPVANGLLAAVPLACSPIVRMVSGASASLHVWITLLGCGAAVLIDAAIILA